LIGRALDAPLSENLVFIAVPVILVSGVAETSLGKEKIGCCLCLGIAPGLRSCQVGFFFGLTLFLKLRPRS
jgi:hypothetical protein